MLHHLTPGNVLLLQSYHESSSRRALNVLLLESYCEPTNLRAFTMINTQGIVLDLPS